MAGTKTQLKDDEFVYLTLTRNTRNSVTIAIDNAYGRELLAEFGGPFYRPENCNAQTDALSLRSLRLRSQRREKGKAPGLIFQQKDSGQHYMEVRLQHVPSLAAKLDARRIRAKDRFKCVGVLYKSGAITIKFND